MNELITRIAAAVDALPEGQDKATFDHGDGDLNVREVLDDLRFIADPKWSRGDGFFKLLDLDGLGKTLLGIAKEKPGTDFTIGTQVFPLEYVASIILLCVEKYALK
jgi:hypothetical protein